MAVGSPVQLHARCRAALAMFPGWRWQVRGPAQESSLSPTDVQMPLGHLGLALLNARYALRNVRWPLPSCVLVMVTRAILMQ